MKINNIEIGGGRTFIIAEIGINHNGDIELAKKLVLAAKDAGCDAVKFQKRTVDVVYTKTELEMARQSPFGETNGDLKRGLEFDEKRYLEIDKYCKQINILWFASPWDEASVDFLEKFNTPCYKVAAASVTDSGLLDKIRATGKPVLLSCGMSSEAEIEKAVRRLDAKNLILMYCRSLYPAPANKINMRAMQTLMTKYPNILTGYSGHEEDTVISAAAVSLGACAVERHFTLDRSMWGSDQKASIEPAAMKTMIENIRLIESALGSPELRCLPEEEPVKKKLRRIDNL
jgi:N-acetylneuraminate synthase